MRVSNPAHHNSYMPPWRSGSAFPWYGKGQRFDPVRRLHGSHECAVKREPLPRKASRNSRKGSRLPHVLP